MKTIFYILFLCLPLSNITIGGHVYVFELPLLLLLPVVLFKKSGGNNKLVALDVIIGSYMFFSLLGVMVDLSQAYEAARYYRINVLTPLALYIVIRKFPLDKSVLKKALLLFTPVIIGLAIYTIVMFVAFGQRLKGLSGDEEIAIYMVTMSLLFFLGTIILLYLRTTMSRKLYYRICIVLAAITYLGLLVSLTRTTIILSIVLIPLGHYFWTRRKMRKMASVGVLSVLLAVIIVMFAGGLTYDGEVIYGEELRAMQRTSDRLLNLDLYMQDLAGRFQFWSRVADMAFENPILGSGGASATIGRSGGTDFYLGNVHNFLLNELVVSGVVGLALTFMQVYLVYRMLTRIDSRDIYVQAFAKIVWIGFTMIIAVGVTGGNSGGRAFFYYMFMALAVRVYLMSKEPVASSVGGTPAAISRKL